MVRVIETAFCGVGIGEIVNRLAALASPLESFSEPVLLAVPIGTMGEVHAELQIRDF